MAHLFDFLKSPREKIFDDLIQKELEKDKEKKIQLQEKILVIIAYFGEFPNFFRLFLKSVQYNKKIDFLLITDNKEKYQYPTNMKVVYRDFEDVSCDIKRFFLTRYNKNVEIDVPYKLCDYRPFYGEIFKEYTTGYDFFGYCDINIILGNISKFLSTIDLHKYNKIYGHEQFTLIKNDYKLAEIFANEPQSDKYFVLDDIAKDGIRKYCFASYNGMYQIFREHNIPTFDRELDTGELDIDQFLFHMIHDNDYESTWIFRFKDGHLYGLNDKNELREYLYIHLKRREMEINIDYYDEYFIIPNAFTKHIEDIKPIDNYMSYFDCRKMDFLDPKKVYLEEQKIYESIKYDENYFNNFSNNEHILSNPDASEKAKRLYSYICSNYGKKIIIGQQETPWVENPNCEMDYIKNITGKLPAIRGFDFVSNKYKHLNHAYKELCDRAIQWNKMGGIITICFHLGISEPTYEASEADKVNFERLFKDGTKENKTMMKQWDQMANVLNALKKKDIPILWRPFHEAEGGWYWWGKEGNENFIKLWRKMYNYYTNDKKLNNLIWVLGYTNKPNKDWYPGDEYCDIIGSDSYLGMTNIYGWDTLKSLTKNKPMTYYECGKFPKIDDFYKEGCVWSWVTIWRDEYLKINNIKDLKDIYNNENIITLDKLPKF